MEPIDFSNKENPDFEDQLAYLIKREFYVSYHKYRKLPYYLIGATLVSLGIILEPSNNLLTLKAMLTIFLALVWMCAILFAIPVIIKWVNRYTWKRDAVLESKNSFADYRFSFDQEKIYFDSPTFKSETSWDHYCYWIENKNSIFIIPKSSLYDALYYSVSDLGVENYSAFKSIASAKLIKLDK